jgi:hypothetical protein
MFVLMYLMLQQQNAGVTGKPASVTIQGCQPAARRSLPRVLLVCCPLADLNNAGLAMRAAGEVGLITRQLDLLYVPIPSKNPILCATPCKAAMQWNLQSSKCSTARWAQARRLPVLAGVPALQRHTQSRSRAWRTPLTYLPCKTGTGKTSTCSRCAGAQALLCHMDLLVSRVCVQGMCSIAISGALLDGSLQACPTYMSTQLTHGCSAEGIHHGCCACSGTIMPSTWARRGRAGGYLMHTA